MFLRYFLLCLLSTFKAATANDITCRYSGTSPAVVNYYTCTELAQKYSIEIETFFKFNPELKTDCSNVAPKTNYCVDATIGFMLSKDGFCGPAHGNASCRGYAGGQCCNSETWKCGKELVDCQAGTCYEGGCIGFPSGYSLDGNCGVQTGNLQCGGKWGDCCNKAGRCGRGADFCDDAHCQSGNCSKLTVRASTTHPAAFPWQTGTTPDGTCGGANKYTCSVAFGNCCSKDGVCGGLVGHCGIGCQPSFGTCTNTTTPPTAPGSISTTGSCGGIDGLTCLGSSFGNCCSVAGFCGSTTGHCNAGCQPAFGSCATTDLSPDGSCGGNMKYKCAGSGFGNCCSASGFCGSTSAHCGSGCQTAFGTCPVTNLSPDGSCGGANKFLCKGSSFGDCCSASGFCGSTTGHCNAGCQVAFGTCSTTGLSPDGTCGGTNAYKCPGSGFGDCCSIHGFCGATTDHCGNGCQASFGSCLSPTTSTASPRPTDVSFDGSCGTNGKKCQGSGFGNCCSAGGFCGDTVNHCAQGCRTTFSSGCTMVNIPSLDGTCGATAKLSCAGGPFDGKCCSAGGFCGLTTDHCGNGCQKGFGVCL